MAKILPIPIETLIAHHEERRATLRGPDGQKIDWLWCLSMWDRLGRPVIYAAPGDPIFDLAFYFRPEKLSPWRLQGIVTWLEEHSGEVTQKLPQVIVPAGWFADLRKTSHKKKERHPVQSVEKPRAKPDPRLQEFSIRFLLATQPYPSKVAIDLIRECRDDIELFGFEYAQKKWAKFVEMPQEGTCPVCGSSNWWYRPASKLGGSGGRLCARCHPKLGEKVERSPVVKYQEVEELKVR